MDDSAGTRKPAPDAAGFGKTVPTTGTGRFQRGPMR